MSECVETTLKEISKAENDINELLNAALRNSDKKIKKLLENGVNIDATDFYDAGKTALMKICSYDIKEYDTAAKLLLENGANPNMLHWSYFNLLKSNILDQTNTAFTFACHRGHICDLNNMCYHGHEKIVKLMLEKYVDISKPESRACDALQKSVYCNQTGIINILLNAGIDVNYMNKYGFTPLAIACIYGRDKAAKFLIDRGADININIPQYRNRSPLDGYLLLDSFSTEPLLTAIKHAGENIMGNSTEIIELLEQNGACE